MGQVTDFDAQLIFQETFILTRLTSFSDYQSCTCWLNLRPETPIIFSNILINS